MTDDRFSRTPSTAGFCEPSKLPRGPRGFALCRQCGTECPGKRRTFCSGACVDAWKEKTDPSFQRRKVFARDKGICQRCRLDVGALEDRVQALASRLSRLLDCYPSADLPVEQRRKLNRRRYSVPRHIRRVQRALAAFGGDRCFGAVFRPALSRSLWEMDHVVPVVRGGGSCGLENLRLLCVPCHRAVTRELAASRAAERRKAKEAAS